MRGMNDKQDGKFSCISTEERVPKDHPLRPIRMMVDRTLSDISPKLEGMYSRTGRPSIAPECLLKALLLQIFSTIRGERHLMNQLDYILLF